MSNEPTQTADELQAEVHSLEEQIRDRTRVLEEKVGQKRVTQAEADAALQEAESNLAIAQEDLRAAEQEKATLQPQYDRCLQNKDQHAKAESYKKDISRAEAELKEADAKIKQLEGRLQAVSTAYKNERERRSLLVARVSTHVEDLAKAVEEKIALTFPIDEADDAPQASVCLRRLAEMSRERETEIQRWTRQGQELAAILEMKKQRAIELRLEADRQMALTTATKDEEIKELIARFQEERQSLQQDIEAVRQSNEEQLQALHRPRVSAAKEVTLSDPSRASQRRELSAPTTKVFSQRTQDLQREKEEVLEKIRATAAEKHKLVRATQELKRQIESEEQKFSASLKNLGNQILNERHEIVDLERDNAKLEEMCESLKVAVRSAER